MGGMIPRNSTTDPPVTRAIRPAVGMACSASAEPSSGTRIRLNISFAPFKFPQGGSLKYPCPYLYLYLFDLNLRGLARLLTFGLCVLWSHNQEWKPGSTKDVFGDAAQDQPSQT